MQGLFVGARESTTPTHQPSQHPHAHLHAPQQPVIGGGEGSYMQQQQQQQQQQQHHHHQHTVSPFAPPAHCPATSSFIVADNVGHDLPHALLDTTQPRHPPSTQRGSDSNSAASAAQQWTNLSHIYGLLATPASPFLDTTPRVCDVPGHLPTSQPQRLYTAVRQMHEHVGSAATAPIPHRSSPLLHQHQQQQQQQQQQHEAESSAAVILSGDSLHALLDRNHYTTYTLMEVGATAQPPGSIHDSGRSQQEQQQQQQHYSTSNQSILHQTSAMGHSRHAQQMPSSPLHQQMLSQHLLAPGTVWTAASAAAAVSTPSAPPPASSTRSPTHLTATRHPYYTGADLASLSSLAHEGPAMVPLQHSSADAPLSSSTGPDTHTFALHTPASNRGVPVLSHVATDVSRTPTYRLADAHAPPSSGTQYYVRLISDSGGVGRGQDPAHSSMVTLTSRPPPPPPLQRHYLQQQQQHLALDAQPAYAHIPTQDDSRQHLTSHRTPGVGDGGSSVSYTLPSMRSAVDLQTPPHASAGRGGPPPRSLIADAGSHSDQGNNWYQPPPPPPQQNQLRPINTVRVTTTAQDITGQTAPQTAPSQPLNALSATSSPTHGVSRRNRDRAVLFVGQLNYEATEVDVSQVFACYGKPLSVVVLKDKCKAGVKGGGSGGGGASRRKLGGSAFVTYGSTLEADTAIIALHGRYNAKDDDPENDDESKYLQVSYGQQTGLISAFGMMHAEKLHASKPENPIPFLAKDRKRGKT
ncbi:hypothetical protein NESM_000632500 [Novymonas esmeraldas]|uniref:RRM domain-containing protein n=1 Tax=Novymonas esmeraldas TaxID=1808958 RepID=A0AAW0ERW6_9TRYP